MLKRREPTGLGDRSSGQVRESRESVEDWEDDVSVLPGTFNGLQIFLFIYLF